MTYKPPPPRPFRWVEAARGRHAVPSTVELVEGEEITVLCGKQLELAHASPRHTWPECQDCCQVWRTAEGIPRRAGSA